MKKRKYIIPGIYSHCLKTVGIMCGSGGSASEGSGSSSNGLFGVMYEEAGEKDSQMSKGASDFTPWE